MTLSERLHVSLFMLTGTIRPTHSLAKENHNETQEIYS